jgi:translation initiation factor 1
MDLKDQLKKLFPEHIEKKVGESTTETELWIQKQPLICKYEKRKGKPVTIIDGYNGSNSDLKKLTSKIKKTFNVGGGFKKSTIIIQGDCRDKIMNLLNEMGFGVKRVGG